VLTGALSNVDTTTPDGRLFLTLIAGMARIWPARKERWSGHYQCDLPRIAEDLAQLDARDKGGELWVSNVFPGRLQAADTYARFVDADVFAESDL
jgi:hypothetical protein